MGTTETARLDQLSEVISQQELLAHWQGHRDLTRRIIAAFPENDFFNFRIGGMRPFSEMTAELLSIAGPGMKEIATGRQAEFEDLKNLKTKEEFLKLWDESTATINEYWNQVPAEKFHDHIKAFGQYEGTVISTILYYIDNEIHHRAQGYVYLRALGVEPAPFWDRKGI